MRKPSTDELADPHALKRGIPAESNARGDQSRLTISQLGVKNGARQTIINAWKKRAIANLFAVLDHKSNVTRTPEAELEKLHAKIGAVDSDLFEGLRSQPSIGGG